MSGRGIFVAQDAHVVSLISPQNITGGVTGQCFNMSGYEHASIIIQLGAQAAAATKILVNACTDASGTGATAQAFRLFAQETAGLTNDVLNTKESIAAAGRTPTASANTFYVIELEASELPAGSPYVQLQITNGANADFYSAVAILSSGRYEGDQSPSATS